MVEEVASVQGLEFGLRPEGIPSSGWIVYGRILGPGCRFLIWWAGCPGVSLGSGVVKWIYALPGGSG